MKNKIKFKKGYSLPRFLKEYGVAEQCRKALFEWRWPQGYHCPKCNNERYCQLKVCRAFQCNRCHHQHTLTGGTLFASTKLPLTTWFIAIHLLTQAKTGLSALALHRQLGVNYKTAWSIKHKLMQVMKE